MDTDSRQAYGWQSDCPLSLHDKIRDDLKLALRSKDESSRDTLRQILSEFPNLTVPIVLESGKKTTRVKKPDEITDDDILDIIRKLVKSEKTVLQYQDAESSVYLELLEKYLPRMASENEINAWIEANIDFSQFKSAMQAMGPIMKHFGKLADGNLVKNYFNQGNGSDLETIDIEYRFRLPDNKEEAFQLQLDSQTIELISPRDNHPPDWTRLEFHQCPNCPLSSDTDPFCPAAISLVDLVRSFDGLSSFDEIVVEIFTSERHLIQPTSAQQGISSLMGLLIAASGCPRSAYFKPMARFHLPMSQPEETMYRATTMYLLAQFYRKQASQDYEMGLEGLASIYRNMQIVNNYLADRIRAASETDSSVNALILLDMHAKTLTYVIEDYLEELRGMFSAYFN